MNNEFYFRMNQEDGQSVSMRCKEEEIFEVLARFAEFLRGCGYYVDKLEHVLDDEVVIKHDEYEAFAKREEVKNERET